jgi:hypothetical protein
MKRCLLPLLAAHCLSAGCNSNPFAASTSGAGAPTGTRAATGTQTGGETQTDAGKAPIVVADSLVVTRTGHSRIEAAWQAAQDDVTAQDQLEYAAVAASSIDQVASAEALSALLEDPGEAQVKPWTKALTSVAFTELTHGTSYTLGVAVRDTAGSISVFTPRTAKTTDNAAPEPSSTIAFRDIGAAGFTVAWDAASDDATETEKLEYRVVSAEAIEDLATIEKCLAVEGSGILADWQAGMTSHGATGLTEHTTVAVGVLVRDADGEIALYAAQLVTTLDETAPVPGTAVTLSQVTSSSASVAWGAATDGSGGPLFYKLVRAADAAAIDTLAEAEGVAASQVVVDWTEGVSSGQLTGLDDAEAFAVTVLVRDAAGNKAIYTPVSGSSLDATAPTPGSALAFSAVGETSLTVSWGAATDNAAETDALEYKLVKGSTPDALDTIEEAAQVSGADLLLDWTAATTSHDVTGLTIVTSYAFAVLVRDGAGQVALYAPATQTTVDLTPPTPGNSGIIQTSTVSYDTLDITWNAASDNVTGAANLLYEIRYWPISTTVASLADAEMLADVASSYATRSSTSFTFTMPSNDSPYGYNFVVIVKDAAGRKAMYTAQRGPQTCFLPGTMITLEDGSAAPIESLEVGDRVQSFDADGRVSSVAVERLLRLSAPSYLVVTTEDGVVRATESHPFLDPKGGSNTKYTGFRTLGSFTVGERLRHRDEDEWRDSRILSIEEVADPVTVYNLHLSGEPHTFFADGFAVHNK